MALILCIFFFLCGLVTQCFHVRQLLLKIGDFVSRYIALGTNKVSFTVIPKKEFDNTHARMKV